MTTIGIAGSEFKARGEGISGDEAAGGGGRGGRGLVLPDEVMADLAGQLVARARAGEPVALTGRDGLLSGLIGQVLQAGPALGLDGPRAGGGADRPDRVPAPMLWPPAGGGRGGGQPAPA